MRAVVFLAVGLALGLSGGAWAETNAPQPQQETVAAKPSHRGMEGEALVEGLDCKHGQDVRLLEVQTRGPGCSLQYRKAGKFEEVASSHHAVDLCQEKMKVVQKNLEEAGFETVVVAPHGGEIKGWQHTDWGTPVKVDMTLDQANEAEFDALVLPGGVMNPDKLRKEEKAVQLVKDFCAAGKTVAAICHGPWLLVEAEVIDGKTVTSWPSIRTDLKHAGANVVDIIMSRQPTALLRACRDRGIRAEAGFEMLVQQVPEYLRFFGFDELARRMQGDLGAVSAMLYPQ